MVTASYIKSIAKTADDGKPAIAYCVGDVCYNTASKTLEGLGGFVLTENELVVVTLKGIKYKKRAIPLSDIMSASYTVDNKGYHLSLSSSESDITCFQVTTGSPVELINRLTTEAGIELAESKNGTP